MSRRTRGSKLVIKCHSREYSHFNYGNERILLSLAVSILSLMSFLIECAVFTSIVMCSLTEFFFWHHSSHEDLQRNLSQQQGRKTGRNKSQFMGVIQPTLILTTGNDVNIKNEFTHESFWSTYEKLKKAHAVEGGRCVEYLSRGLFYLFLYFLN